MNANSLLCKVIYTMPWKFSKVPSWAKAENLEECSNELPPDPKSSPTLAYFVMEKMWHGCSAFTFPFTTAVELGEQFRQLGTSQPGRYVHMEGEAQQSAGAKWISSAGVCCPVLGADIKRKQQEHGELGHRRESSSKGSGWWKAEMGTCGQRWKFSPGDKGPEEKC